MSVASGRASAETGTAPELGAPPTAPELVEGPAATTAPEFSAPPTVPEPVEGPDVDKLSQPSEPEGRFIVFEGGDGVGKSTQAKQLAAWVAEQGREVVLTFEPGDTEIGARLRDLVLNHRWGDVSPRAEALMYAADKAQHVDEVVLPALRRGAVVISDRYVDSMLAYQGAGRVLSPERVEQVARWATQDLLPDLTVLLDLEPSQGLATISEKDRLEDAGVELHLRARQFFLDLAARDPEHYLVLPARAEIDELAGAVRQRVASLLSVPAGTVNP